jgi:hypothetical protein
MNVNVEDPVGNVLRSSERGHDFIVLRVVSDKCEHSQGVILDSCGGCHSVDLGTDGSTLPMIEVRAGAVACLRVVHGPLSNGRAVCGVRKRSHDCQCGKHSILVSHFNNNKSLDTK